MTVLASADSVAAGTDTDLSFDATPGSDFSNTNFQVPLTDLGALDTADQPTQQLQPDREVSLGGGPGYFVAGSTASWEGTGEATLGDASITYTSWGNEQVKQGELKLHLGAEQQNQFGVSEINVVMTLSGTEIRNLEVSAVDEHNDRSSGRTNFSAENRTNVTFSADLKTRALISDSGATREFVLYNDHSNDGWLATTTETGEGPIVEFERIDTGAKDAMDIAVGTRPPGYETTRDGRDLIVRKGNVAFKVEETGISQISPPVMADRRIS